MKYDQVCPTVRSPPPTRRSMRKNACRTRNCGSSSLPPKKSTDAKARIIPSPAVVRESSETRVWRKLKVVRPSLPSFGVAAVDRDRGRDEVGLGPDGVEVVDGVEHHEAAELEPGLLARDLPEPVDLLRFLPGRLVLRRLGPEGMFRSIALRLVVGVCFDADRYGRQAHGHQRQESCRFLHSRHRSTLSSAAFQPAFGVVANQSGTRRSQWMAAARSPKMNRAHTTALTNLCSGRRSSRITKSAHPNSTGIA